MKSLFKIQEEYLQLMDKIQEQEGVLDEETENQLAIAEHELQAKVVAYDHIIKQLESQSKMADDEIDRIKKFKKIKDNAIDRMKSALLQALLMFGEKDPKKDIWRLEAETTRLSTRQSKSTEIDNLEVDPKYKVYTLKGLSGSQVEKALELFSNMEGVLPEIVESVPKTPVKEDIESDPDKKEDHQTIRSDKIKGAYIVKKYSLTIK